MKIAFPVQQVKLVTSMTRAQFAVVWALTGRRPTELDKQINVNGVNWEDCFICVDYVYDKSNPPGALFKRGGCC